MRVISKSRLRIFWETPGHELAKGPLQAWYKHVSSKSVQWRPRGDLAADFASADAVGNCTVFNIGGNKFRLIARVLFASQKVFVLKVMTHDEYDRQSWKDECNCFSPPSQARSKATNRGPNQPK